MRLTIRIQNPMPITILNLTFEKAGSDPLRQDLQPRDRHSGHSR